MPNILELTGSFNQGGSERQALQLSRLLKNDGKFNVFLATLNLEGVLLDEARSYGFENIPEFKLTSFFDANAIAQVKRFRRFVKENEIRLIHTHDFYTNVFGVYAGWVAGIPVRISSKREMQGFRGAKQEMVERQAFRLSQAITVNAHAVKDFLISRKVPAEKIVVTYNGLDFDRLQTAPDRSRSQKCCELGLPDDNGLRFVSIVANLRHDVKNIPMFLRAAKIISERYPDVRFVIAGEGQLEGQLKRMASELGVDGKCLFIGRCGNVPDLLSVSEICVLSSFYEGFSNSILEYMAASKPVVATDVGGAAEAIAEGVSGFLVQSDDHTAMAERIESLIADPETGQKMGEKGREIIETRFSTAAQLNQITALYESLLSKH